MAPMAPKTKTHSCLTCRKRKVRCTRQQPCMYCTRTGRQCVFPETTKKTRQRKPTAREEVCNRLERPECMVKDIITNREDINEMENDSQATNVATVPTEALSQGSDTTLPTIHESGNHLPSCRLDERSTQESTLSLDQPNQGSIPSSGNNPLPSPRDSLQIDCWTFEGRAFPFQSPRISYPFLDLTPALWHIYADNVAPLFPLLHKPSARNLLLLGTPSKQSMTQSKKALILSILFVAVVSMSPAKCGMVLKESRDDVVRYLKNEVKQASSIPMRVALFQG